jgi:hypothetical protein
MQHQGEVKVEKFRLYSVAELLRLDAPEWLIYRIFSSSALVGVYGPSGEGKTFLALDWALSVAQGEEWAGRGVTQGPVVYVAAEGGRSIGKRVRAWMKARGQTDVPEAFFLLESVQVRDGSDLELVVSRIGELGMMEPSLIVFDTLARCFVGGEENSAMEMGQFVEGLEWLRRETRAAVMVLHHTGKQAQELERGSTALRGAADVMIRVSKKDNVITVKNNKQKDDEEFDDINLRLRQVALAGGEGADTSCVLESVAARSATGGLLPHLRKTLSTLASSTDGTLATAEWAEQAHLKNRTLHSHRQELVNLGYVEEVTRGTYRATERGKEVALRALERCPSAASANQVQSVN